MLPKEAPLSVMDKNKETSPILLHFAPRGAKFYCHRPNMPIAIYDKQEN